MLRRALLISLAGCGRVGFDGESRVEDAAVPDGPAARIVHFPMDDDPTLGMLHATPSTFDTPCLPCPAATPGIDGGGYRFDGTLRVPLANLALDLEPFTVALWMEPDATSTQQSAISQPVALDTALNVFKLFVAPNGHILYESGFAALYEQVPDVPTRMVVEGWHHVAATWDGTMRSLFVDGELYAAEVGAFTPSTLPLGIGGDSDFGDDVHFFSGVLDELYVAARVLTAAEIRELATRTSPVSENGR